MDHLIDKPLHAVPVVVLDTETTGLSPAVGHRIIEIAAVRLEGGQEVAQLSQLLNPGRSVDPAASRVNGIYDHQMTGIPEFSGVATELAQLLEGAVCVAHNAPFDAGFLAMEYSLLHRQRSEHPATLPNPWVCTLQLARRCFYFGRNNLGHVAQQLGVRVGRAHRALNDVYTTLEVFRRMARVLEGRRLTTVGDLLHVQGGPIYMPAPAKTALPAPIDEALKGRLQLRILYQSGYSTTERVITPLYPTERRGQRYLIAFCHLRQAQRTFRLDRIQKVELLEE